MVNSFYLDTVHGPHNNQAVYTVQTPVPDRVIICIHGRGATAEPMLEIGQASQGEYVAFAPQAAHYTWYPQRFIELQSSNEPWLSSAIDVIAKLLVVAEERGFASEQVILTGFSQGACLVAEFVKRHPKKYRGVVLMSGGLIGTDVEVEQNCSGELHATPIYIGSDVADGHIPWQRAQQTADCFTSCGANVTLEQYQDFGHAIHPHAVSYLSTL